MNQRFPKRIHDYLRDGRWVRRGTTQPFPRFTYKEYPRMPRIALPQETLTAPLESVLARRTSDHDDTPSSPPHITHVGTLLGHALRMRSDMHRPYPSGGSHYPIETYLIGHIDTHEPAVFHYQPYAHALEHLWNLPQNFNMETVCIDEHAAAKPLAIVLTASWHKTMGDYGNFAYILGMLEAGHASQNLLLCAEALGIRACAIGGFYDQNVVELLDLDEDVEQVVHLIALGAREEAFSGRTAQ